MKSYAWLATKGHMPYINNKDQGIMYIVLAASPVKYNKCNNIDVAFFISHHKTRFEMCLTKEKKVGGVEFSFSKSVWTISILLVHLKGVIALL